MPSPPLSSSLGRSTFFPLWTKFFVNYTVHWLVVVRFKPRIRLLESCYGDWLFIRREREREKLFQSVTSIDRKISFSSSFARVIYPVILCGQDQSRKFNYLVDKSRRFAFFEILWYFDEDNSLLSFINIISANVNMIFSFSRIIRSGFLTSLDVNYIATLLKAWAIFFFGESLQLGFWRDLDIQFECPSIQDQINTIVDETLKFLLQKFTFRRKYFVFEIFIYRFTWLLKKHLNKRGKKRIANRLYE